MSKVSVIIPSRNERFLQNTIEDIFAKARGEIEILAVLDGYWPTPPLPDYPNLITIHRSESQGMRAAINGAASIAKGEYLLKSDAHCLFGEGFDEILKADCEDDWVVVPRRYRLDAENWKIQDNGKPPVDYHYLSWPYEKPGEIGMHGNVWVERAKERLDIPIDDEMSSQGSCWFMPRKHFDRIGGMPEEGYGRFVQEAQQLFNKTWLSGGRCVINKLTWYSHLHKGTKYGRGYHISKKEMIKGAHWSADYWLNDRWPERTRNLEWLIEKFNPPGWPENWQELRHEYELGKDGLIHKR